MNEKAKLVLGSSADSTKVVDADVADGFTVFSSRKDLLIDEVRTNDMMARGVEPVYERPDVVLKADGHQRVRLRINEV